MAVSSTILNMSSRGWRRTPAANHFSPGPTKNLRKRSTKSPTTCAHNTRWLFIRRAQTTTATTTSCASTSTADGTEFEPARATALHLLIDSTRGFNIYHHAMEVLGMSCTHIRFVSAGLALIGVLAVTGIASPQRAAESAVAARSSSRE